MQREKIKPTREDTNGKELTNHEVERAKQVGDKQPCVVCQQQKQSRVFTRYLVVGVLKFQGAVRPR